VAIAATASATTRSTASARARKCWFRNWAAGGQLVAADVGGTEVADLARYDGIVQGLQHTPDRMGGTMDLVSGARRVIVLMEHVTKKGDA
jgi:acyl CoA:acetate/3-ketoacid CoA transferase beta subunit